MKIHLINSIIGEATEYLKHGIGILGAVLKQHDFDIEFVNNPDGDAWFPDEVEIGAITGLTSCVPRIKQLAADIKEESPDSIIFVGGPGATLSPEFLKDDENIDYIYLGEGEITFTEILLHYRETGELPNEHILTGEIVHDVNVLPYVDRTGFETGENKMPMIADFGPPMFSMLNSRWCRKKCKFCAPAMSTLFGGVKKLRSVEHFTGELETLNPDYMTLVIHDDNMFENVEWCKKLVEAFRERNWWIPFITQGYPTEIALSKDLLAELKTIGLVGIMVGFESGSDRMLKYMRKGCTRDYNIKAAQVMQELDIRIQANLMFGNPTETLSEMMETVSLYNDHIFKAGLSMPSQAVYTPHPGSVWYNELKAKNMINITDFKDYERYANTAGKIKGVNYADVDKAVRSLKPWQGFAPLF